MLTLAALEAAADRVHDAMRPTPQYAWPLLARRAGCEVWVKHENHTPTGAFKVRGGLNLLGQLARSPAPPRGVASATRGNHGQSLAYAARQYGMTCTIVVPHGNSPAKNASMREWGAELIEQGVDFDEARVFAKDLAVDRQLRFVPPFEDDLVAGVASYALELFTSAPPLDHVFVPIGCGSGICGLIAARDALKLSTSVIGVVSTNANAYAQSFRAGRAIETASASTMADGVAVRVPVEAALDVIRRGAQDVVEVDDEAIEQAMRFYFDDTHQVLEGAGAAPLAALMRWPQRSGKRAGLIASGGNVDRDVYARVLADR
ncbi:MAG TPA: threonine dehydratase [Casimicrobiaceae bacterium]|nr:threonine dehydratase [Casimicrobiaceae bacterium]